MASWLVRLVRAHRLDRNPLRRGIDRLETVVLAVLVAAVAAGTAFAAITVGGRVYAFAHREQVAQLAAEHKVAAAVRKVVQVNSGDLAGDAVVTARWTAPDGRVVTGDVLEPTGTSAGETIQVWITRDGRATLPPLRDSQVSGEVILAEIGCVLAGGLALVVACTLSRRALDRRRMADWESEWRAGPHWSTRA